MIAPIYRFLFTAAVTLFLLLPVHAQTGQDVISQIKAATTDTERLEIYAALAKRYIYASGSNQEKLDSGVLFLHMQLPLLQSTALPLTNIQRATAWAFYYCDYSKYCAKTGQTFKSNQLSDSLFTVISRLDDYRDQGAVLKQTGKRIPLFDAVGLTRVSCFEKLRALYQIKGDRNNTLGADIDIADVHMLHGNLNLAEKELLTLLETGKKSHYPYLHEIYNLLSVINYYKGNFNTSLNYALQTVKQMHSSRDTSQAMNFYARLAHLYYALGETASSIEYFQLELSREIPPSAEAYPARDAGYLVRALIKENRAAEAFRYFTDFMKRYPSPDDHALASADATWAYYYYSQGDTANGERYMKKAIQRANTLQFNNEVTQEVNFDISQYYFTKKDYNNALRHLQISLQEAQIVNAALLLKDIYHLHYRIDSAMGNYATAIEHYNQYISIKDSIFSEVKSRQIEELQVQFESEKKDAKIQLQEKSLQQSRLIRNITYILIAAFALIAALFYNRYRMKQKVNAELEYKQKLINQKNASLEQLITEKEWLVKEIHHRVKNNFHVVASLLEIQSSYLRNREALTAIKESQHRIHSMSIIHQKLYQSDTLSTINMREYIYELVEYLRESFAIRDNIHFNLDVESVDLNHGYAITLGLILNEAITNSIKYAFEADRSGDISISLRHISDAQLLLIIGDNGKGLPSGFNAKTGASMGMELLQGLTEDIGGSLNIKSENGLQIDIIFSYKTSGPHLSF
ncbi:sensor histidine kinase [Chitinophaga agri]|uniref:histidine kinase n=1 Tax=Chitinophaga agri TaxID=2703787 RepID=A0A6B9ZJ10_9BACT|nr:sensor histidine kinase [Chitinophaga agri]QHS61957.1 hypothetical protein GWR21_20810 [Chitinophaga agri]